MDKINLTDLGGAKTSPRSSNLYSCLHLMGARSGLLGLLRPRANFLK